MSDAEQKGEARQDQRDARTGERDDEESGTRSGAGSTGGAAPAAPRRPGGVILGKSGARGGDRAAGSGAETGVRAGRSGADQDGETGRDAEPGTSGGPGRAPDPRAVPPVAPAGKSDRGGAAAGLAESQSDGGSADPPAAASSSAPVPPASASPSAEPPGRPMDREPAGPAAREPADREPSAKEPADREPAAREPADREPLDREPADRRPANVPAPRGTNADAGTNAGTSTDRSRARGTEGNPDPDTAKGAAKSSLGDDAGDATPARSEPAAKSGRTAPARNRGGTPAAPERLLAGRYRLGDVLGRGGMGTVWRAQDEILGRTVAVKELRFPNSIDEEEKRRLITRTLREAKAIARIRNNSAVTVYDVVDEDDRPWIVMELVEGKSLAEAIREDGLLTPRRAAEVGLAVLDVLRAAHSEGILHRDVKPSNVLIADDGRVVLTDFGIAQVEGDPSITSTGMLVGAPSYISPERARGHRPGPAADLWSLGGLLYASVEGIPPYDKGSAIATLTAVMTEPLDPPQNAGPLEEVIYGLLAKDPEQRLDDAGARALLTHVVSAPEETVTAGSDPTMVVAMPVVPQSVGERWGERKKRSLRKGAAGAAGAAGAVAPGAARPVPPPPRPAPALGASASGAPATDRPARPGGAGSAHDGYGPPTTGLLAGYTAGAATGAPDRRSAATGAAGAPGTSVPSGSASGPVNRTAAGSAAPKAALTDVVPRRTLMVIAMVVAIAVIAGIVALVMREDPATGAKNSDKVASSGATTGDDDKDGGKDDGAAPGGPTPGADGATKDTGDGKDTEGTGTGGEPGKGTTTDPATGPGKDASGDGKDQGEDKGKNGGAGSGTGVASTYKHSQGFSVGLPEGWSFRSTSAAGARFTGPGGQRLLIGWTSTPKSDAAADWRNQEGSMRRAQYERIRIESVGFRGWESADWEFTYVESGTKYRVTNRGFVVDSSQGYAIMYTAKAADWSGAERRETWQTFTRTFQPRS